MKNVSLYFDKKILVFNVFPWGKISFKYICHSDSSTQSLNKYKFFLTFLNRTDRNNTGKDLFQQLIVLLLTCCLGIKDLKFLQESNKKIMLSDSSLSWHKQQFVSKFWMFNVKQFYVVNSMSCSWNDRLIDSQ